MTPKEYVQALGRAGRITTWRRGCSCCMPGCNSISFGEHCEATVRLVVNCPDHKVMLLGDEQHIKDFIEDLKND